MYISNFGIVQLKWPEKISDHIYVSVCISVTCAISGTSGTNNENIANG